MVEVFDTGPVIVPGASADRGRSNAGEPTPPGPASIRAGRARPGALAAPRPGGTVPAWSATAPSPSRRYSTSTRPVSRIRSASVSASGTFRTTPSGGDRRRAGRRPTLPRGRSAGRIDAGTGPTSAGSASSARDRRRGRPAGRPAGLAQAGPEVAQCPQAERDRRRPEPAVIEWQGQGVGEEELQLDDVAGSGGAAIDHRRRQVDGHYPPERSDAIGELRGEPAGARGDVDRRVAGREPRLRDDGRAPASIEAEGEDRRESVMNRCELVERGCDLGGSAGIRGRAARRRGLARAASSVLAPASSWPSALCGTVASSVALTSASDRVGAAWVIPLRSSAPGRPRRRWGRRQATDSRRT